MGSDLWSLNCVPFLVDRQTDDDAHAVKVGAAGIADLDLQFVHDAALDRQTTDDLAADVGQKHTAWHFDAVGVDRGITV